MTNRIGVAVGVLAWSVLALAEACSTECTTLRDEVGESTGESRAKPLFNGRDLAGWWGMSTEDPRRLLSMSAAERAVKRQASLSDIHAHWSVDDGELVNDGEGLFLTTDEDFGDFELQLEYRTVAGADSGIYLRGIPQVQIWDWTEAGGKWPLGARRGSGGLWNNTAGAPGRMPSHRCDRPFGEWNTVWVRMVGDVVSVKLNEVLVVDSARLENYFDRGAPLPARGPIQLQTHGGEIRWRGISIRELGPSD